MSKFRIILISMLLVIPVLHSQAQSVDLLWQGNTYVPPFYKGRALWANQSRVSFVAIPQGLGSSDRLYYKWTKNGTVLGNINGLGQNMISFTDSILSIPQTIKVEILSRDNTVALATASVFVAPTSPTLSVYENNPLYGFMFHREIGGTFPLKEKEVAFAAFPLFFGVSSRFDGILTYEWRTNNSGEGAETTNSVTYRSPDNTAGISEIRARVSNTDKIMQTADMDFLLQFGK